MLHYCCGVVVLLLLLLTHPPLVVEFAQQEAGLLHVGAGGRAGPVPAQRGLARQTVRQRRQPPRQLPPPDNSFRISTKIFDQKLKYI